MATEFEKGFRDIFLAGVGAMAITGEKAKEVLAHAEAIKAAGARYCDCPACAACEAILKHKEELIG